MRLALIGFGNVGKAFARLLHTQQARYPFRIVGVHTAKHGSWYGSKGLGGFDPAFGPPASSVSEFLGNCEPDILIEITTLNPETGEPAIEHIRTAFRMGIHVVTANKGPIAHAYASICEEARMAALQFRFESTVMDGTPVFNLVRNNLPGVRVLGFEGVLNSTSKVVLAAMARGSSLPEAIREAQEMGIAESNVSFDLDGWDSAAKTAALANVLMDAGTTPQRVLRGSIRDFSRNQIIDIASRGKAILLVSRALRADDGLQLKACPEIVDRGELLACAAGSSNALLLHTDLMGTIAMLSINPGLEQTAYGVFSDVVDIARAI